MKSVMSHRLLQLAEAHIANGPYDMVTDRRAVSDSYYAVFHVLAHLCSTELLGAAQWQTSEYERVYRALDHRQLREAFATAPLKNNAKLRSMGRIIAQLQAERHRADYLPAQRLYSLAQCKELIELVREVVTELENLAPEDRRTLSICLLFKNRLQ